MKLITADKSVLLLIDFQQKLMPAIEDSESILKNANSLANAARLIEVPIFATEQAPDRLGITVPGLLRDHEPLLHKTHFSATLEVGFNPWLPPGRDVIVGGCETHICVLQTVLGLLTQGRRVFIVDDALGSREARSKDLAIERMVFNGAQRVSTEMVLFEWMRSSQHPHFKEIQALIK
jgi:nicotinamidase-related amidase